MCYKNTFKARFRGHKSSFKKIKYLHSTRLSEHIWELKARGTQYSMKWSILGRAQPYSLGRKECNLCNLEKYFLIMNPEGATLNKQDELMAICRHRKQALLVNLEE